jgi:DNA-binding Lrp family transcriptional regulator
MNLSGRDIRIIQYIKDQGFVTYNELCDGYFHSLQDCSRRLSQLERAGFIDRKTLKSYFQSSQAKYYFPHLLPLGVNQNTQIISLSARLRKFYPDYDLVFRKDILLHQLYLGKVRRHFSERFKNDLILSEYEMKTLSNLIIDRNSDVHPDLSFERGEIRLALEMERTKKAFDRYFSKFYNFYDSSYSHVLYVFINQKSMASVLGMTKIYRKIGFALMSNLNEVYSPVFGKLLFDDWFSRIEAISKG